MTRLAADRGELFQCTGEYGLWVSDHGRPCATDFRDHKGETTGETIRETTMGGYGFWISPCNVWS